MVVGFWRFCQAVLRCDNRLANTASREGAESTRGPMEDATPAQRPGEISPRAVPSTRYERAVTLRRKLEGEVPCMRAF